MSWSFSGNPAQTAKLSSKQKPAALLPKARVLAEKGFQSSSRVGAFEAQLDGARAALKQAEIEADNINIRAPFSGIWERQDAQVGDYLSPGMSCGLLVELSPLKIGVELTETQLSNVARGNSADILLATGEKVTGKVTFIEAKADPCAASAGQHADAGRFR